jgi:hypothetical protein
VGVAENANVYIISVAKREALAWAQRNKPGLLPKVGHPDNALACRGLHLQDVPVYVLDEPAQEVRDEWIRTGARLVYV